MLHRSLHVRPALLTLAGVAACLGLLSPAPSFAEPTPATRPATTPATAPSTQPSGDAAAAPIQTNIHWQMLTRTGQVVLDSGEASYTINLNGQMTFAGSATRVLAFGNPVVITEALDQDRHSLTQSRNDIVQAMGMEARPQDMNFQPIQFNDGQPNAPIGIYLPQIAGKPTKISSLKGYGVLLIANKTQIKIIEARAGDFTQVLDGMEMKVENLQLQPNYANVSLLVRKPGTPQRGMRNMMEPPVIQSVELVDDQGNAIANNSMNFNFRGYDGNGILIQYQTNYQSQTRGIQDTKTLRVKIATQLKEQRVPFALTDIPLP